MLSNLLNVVSDLTDPDNTPSGYGGVDTAPLWVLFLACIATVITVVASYIIYKLYKKAFPQNKPTKILILLIVITLILITVYFVLAYIGGK